MDYRSRCEYFRYELDAKTAKTANLHFARSSAIWPDASDDQLQSGKQVLTALLVDRLQGLIDRFKSAMQDCGFDWE